MDELLSIIRNAVAVAQGRPKGPENKWVLTKLREAEFWQRAGLGLWDAVPEEPELSAEPEPSMEQVGELDESLAIETAMESPEPGAFETEIPEAEPHPLTKPRKRPVER